MIEAFLRSLRDALRGRLSAPDLDRRLREAESHLQASAKEFGEAEAVRRYGSARFVANALVRVHRGYATASAARLLFCIGVAFCLATAVPLLLLERAARTRDSFESAAFWFGWAPFIALIAFGVRALQTRRWLVLPALLWIVGGYAIYLAGLNLLPPFPTPGHDPETFRYADRLYAEHQAQIAAWRRGSPPANRAPQLCRVTNRSNIPLTPFHYDAEEPPTIELGEARSTSESRRLWNRYGEAWAAKLKEEREASRTPKPLGVWRLVMNLLGSFLPVLLFTAAVLTVVNWIVLVLAAFREGRVPTLTR